MFTMIHNISSPRSPAHSGAVLLPLVNGLFDSPLDNLMVKVGAVEVTHALPWAGMEADQEGGPYRM